MTSIYFENQPLYKTEGKFCMSDYDLKLARHEMDSKDILSGYQNKQKYVRSSVFVEAELIVDGKGYGCVIVNISPGGARLKVINEIPEAKSAILKTISSGEFHCDISRHASDFVAVVFTDSRENIKKIVDEILGRSDLENDNRVFPRRAVMFNGQSCSGVRIFKCRVVDISLTGARVVLETNHKLEPCITLRIHRFGDFYCKVARHAEDFVGLSFLEPPSKILDSFGHLLPRG